MKGREQTGRRNEKSRPHIVGKDGGLSLVPKEGKEKAHSSERARKLQHGYASYWQPWKVIMEGADLEGTALRGTTRLHCVFIPTEVTQRLKD